MPDRPYLVTARKHRPNTFGEVVAQDHITETLKNALRLDRLAHAYLFSGPRGVGKTTVARILAKAINCETPPVKRDDPSEPCRTCRSCRDFESGRSLTIFEIDAASNNKVEDVRELRETVRFPPQGAKKKVYIVDEVHMLSNAAFNALLKTLEEPPPYVLFIFATTEPHKVLPTILSRCQRFDFRRIPVDDIVGHLTDICDREKVTADTESLILLARKGDGALRDALSVFDQAVALCGTELRYASLAEALRVVDIDLFFSVTNHVAGRNVAGMLSLVERIVRSGFDLQDFLVGLAEHLRNLLVARAMKDGTLIEAANATQQRYVKEAGSFTETVLIRLLMVVDETEQSIAVSSHPRLTLEMALIKMAGLSDAVNIQEALRQLERVEELAQQGRPLRRAKSPAPAVEASAAEEPLSLPDTLPSPAPRSTTPAPKRDTSPDTARSGRSQPALPDMFAGGDLFGPPALPRSRPGTEPTAQSTTVVAAAQSEGVDSYVALWPDIVRMLKETKIQVGSMLGDSRPLSIEDGELVIGVPNDLHHRTLNEVADEVLVQFETRVPVQRLRFVVQAGVVPIAQDPATMDPREYIKLQRKENPVIRKLIDDFGAELVW